MNCPYCSTYQTYIVRTERLTTEVIRLRRCDKCKSYFETVETLSRKVTPDERYRTKQFEKNQVKLTDLIGGQ